MHTYCVGFGMDGHVPTDVNDAIDAEEKRGARYIGCTVTFNFVLVFFEIAVSEVPKPKGPKTTTVDG